MAGPNQHQLEKGLGPEQQHSLGTVSSSLDMTTGTGPQSPITHLPLTFSTALPHLPYSPPVPPPNLMSCTNPLTWPAHQKNLVLLLSSIATFLCAYTAGSYSPPQSLIQHSLSPMPPLRGVLAGITTFCFGFAIAPMFLAPFSEQNGRYPVFVASGILYVVMEAVCGVVKTLPQLLIARFFVGVGASVFSTMVGGVISDMYIKEERNTPMAVFSGFVLAGTGVGPMVGAVMAERLRDDDKWKWVWWHQVLMGGLLMVALVVFFKESRGSVLLSRKATRLNEWYEGMEKAGKYGVIVDEPPSSPETTGSESESSSSSSWSTHTPTDNEKEGKRTKKVKRIRFIVESDSISLRQMIVLSTTRPFHLLFTEPVVFSFSLWVSFAWGILYLTFGSVPLMFQQTYNFTLEQSGYVFSAIIVGSVLATILAIWQESLLKHPKWAPPSPFDTVEGVMDRNNNASSGSPYPSPTHMTGIQPPSPSSATPSPSSPSSFDPLWQSLRKFFPVESAESRLYPSLLLSALLPLGLLLFGLSSTPKVHFLLPSLGLLLSTIGIFSIYLAVFNYLADIYTTYASSALAAQSFCRNVLAGIFPLITKTLWEDFGRVNTTVCLGMIGMVLTAVPWVLVWKGESIRGRSRFAVTLR
ncbi:major facilitator superfamily domain-containing protein [Cladorrhinum sp. PSN259]|nr:major facilitator superfamily domain-containing protein [Cladorrhinum sp. PSN259]